MKALICSKGFICTVTGTIGSFIAWLFGGWTSSLTTLLIFMLIDYITGLIVAGVFHKSPKTETGALESRAGFKGLIRKCMTLVYVLVAHRVDIEIGMDYCRTAVCIAFIVNEGISILENGGLMGMKIPPVIRNAIEILKKKGESENA